MASSLRGSHDTEGTRIIWAERVDTATLEQPVVVKSLRKSSEMCMQSYYFTFRKHKPLWMQYNCTKHHKLKIKTQTLHLQTTWNDTQMEWKTCVLNIMMSNYGCLVKNNNKMCLKWICFICLLWPHPFWRNVTSRQNYSTRWVILFFTLCFEPYLEFHQPFYALNNIAQSTTLYNLCAHDIINT